ncbi:MULTISPECIES: RDD family protein [Haloarcula]|uniref:RDD family protein n=1 Tax=Haloarcula TaxID=2237 RepID=UPI0023E7C4F0|nr:RDD family protein [Halomicroarcula sp. SHR3]
MCSETGEDIGQLSGAGKRTGAFIIDSVVSSVVLAVLLVIPVILLVTNTDPAVWLAGYVVFNVVALGYRILFEGLYGYTPGKKLVDIVVVAEDGSDIGRKAAAVRNPVLIADNLQVASLLGLGLILYDEDEQRLGDMAANAYVVRT